MKEEFPMKNPTPIFRIFDEEKAKEFYLSYLGFTLDWEYQFEDGLPLYMQVSYGGISIHLSEHHGDCSPGAALRIEMENVEELEDFLRSKLYKHSRPILEHTPWETKEITVVDPFANRLVFFENNSSKNNR